MRIFTAIAMTIFMTGAAMADDTARIMVIGEGEVTASPDMATVTLGVVSQNETAKSAVEENSAEVAALLETLKNAGIESRDVQTSGLSLNPQWDNGQSGPPKLISYRAENTVNVRVRALADLGDILGGVLDAGANTFNGLAFGLQDPKPKLDEARRAAIADARHRAELYAAAAGVQLGKIMSISEQTQPGGQPGDQMWSYGAAVPIAEGEISLTARVTVIWEIVE